jgi:hypothetical protein
VATVTGKAGQAAQTLSLDEGALSWASNPTGLLATYAEIQSTVADLLAEGTTVFNDLSTALDRVLHAYQVNDEQAAARLKGTWDARD